MRDVLRHHDLPQDVRDDAVLVISELVTHAVLHATGATVSCEARVLAGCVHLEVRDEGQVSAAGGCGLLLVDRIAEACGARPAKDGAGRAVWATLPFRRPGDSPTRSRGTQPRCAR